jgi:hypothetical protein
MPTDHEALQITIEIAHLRRHAAYRNAELRRRQLGDDGAEIMARSHQNSQDYADFRLLVGTWNRISLFVEEFSEKQLHRFFRCNPIALTWKVLEPGILVVRNEDDVAEPANHPKYAWALQDLAEKYDAWIAKDGHEYRSEARQAACADFG